MTQPPNGSYKLQHSSPEPPPFPEADMNGGAPVQRPEATADLPPISRPRTGSVKQPPPINESVAHTLNDQAQAIGGGVSPSLIATITEQVLKEIESRKQPTAFPIPPNFYPPHAPLSPTASVHSQPVPQRDVYTPPSPQRHNEFPAESPPRRGKADSIGSVGAGSPPRQNRDPLSNTPPKPSVSMGSPAKTAPPLVQQPPPRVGSQSPFSGASEASRRASMNDPDSARPTTATKTSDSEETTLEKIWGKLFGEDGKPTEKLGQLLRGMAEYMIESYEPKNSLVVTPSKMQRYYRETHISKEPYPWSTIFDDTVSCISRMYRELGCEHHLVQEPDEFYEKPDIPGLTPRGFQHWATMMVLAHPDEAFERLRRIVREFPINNPDIRSERFPKELPRRLFPSEPNLRIRDILIDAIEEHAKVNIDDGPSATPRQFVSTQSTPAPSSQQTPQPPPQVTVQPEARPPSRSQQSEAASETGSMASSIERERQPYSGNNMPSSCSIDDINRAQPQPPPPQPAPPQQQPRPIERERKPYSGKEGEGRSFNVPPPGISAPSEDARSPLPPHTNTFPLPAPRQTSQPPPPPPSIRRSNSNSAATGPSSRPINIPPSSAGPPRQRGEHAPPPPSASANYSQPPRSGGLYHRGSTSSGRRPRGYSPPPGAPFRASEPDMGGPGGPGMSQSFDAGPFWDGRDDRRFEYRERERERDRDRDRPRDDGSLPPPPPIGRRDTTRGGSPGRRSSMYGADEEFYRPRRETTGGSRPW